MYANSDKDRKSGSCDTSRCMTFIEEGYCTAANQKCGGGELNKVLYVETPLRTRGPNRDPIWLYYSCPFHVRYIKKLAPLSHYLQ